jgi:glycosyltransferase involved in cell wall biosynthesis
MKRPGQLMRRLSASVPVVYVEPPLSATSVLKNWRTGLSGASSQRLRRGLARRASEVAPGIHVVTTLVSIAPQRLSFALSPKAIAELGSRQRRRMALRAYRAAEALGVSKPIVWITYPMALVENPKRAPAAVVYDCMDRWTDFPHSMADASGQAHVADLERRLLHRADVVFCSAQGLFDSKRVEARSRVLLVRNGADVAHFAPTGRPAPEDIAELPRPILGYVGAVAEWVDFELLRAVALACPEWSVVLIGPVFKGQSTGDSRTLRLIADLPNVHILGPRPYDDVPDYLESFDVAIIPFQCNGLTEDTNPIKVYEYLAAGVPVVSTPLPEVTALPGVRVAATPEAFVIASEAACRERWDPDLISVRMDVAEQNSWEARAQTAWDAVCECISEDGGPNGRLAAVGDAGSG